MIETVVVWSSGLWERRDYPTVMSGWVVRYTIGNELLNRTEISASRDRVSCQRLDITTESEGIAALDILKCAWRQHLHLKGSGGNRPLPEITATSPAAA